MVIPLPSKRKRFTITLTVKALRPVSIRIIAYDPTVPHADYFRRKVTFHGPRFKKSKHPVREISIPLPVSPDQLVLEIHNAHTLDDTGFRITAFDVNEMAPTTAWASPERHRFMNFAIRFAQKAGHLRPGFYPSPDHEFLIQYLPVITDQWGSELVTPARIHRQMPRVQLSRALFRRFTIPVRVAILSHEGCHYFLNTRSERNADLCGIQYYLDYGFPTIEAVYAVTNVFRQHPQSIGQAHLTRTADILQFIDHYKAGKQKQKTKPVKPNTVQHA